MAGVGYGGYFSQDPDPNPINMNIPSTGAVLNDNNEPKWEEPAFPLPALTYGSTVIPPVSGVHFTATGDLSAALENLEARIFALIQERVELIAKIEEERNKLNTVLDKSKKLTDDLSLLDMLEEPLTLKKEEDNG